MLLLLTAAQLSGAAHQQPAAGPAHGCLPPHANESFCDTSLPAAKRAELLVAQLTVPELVGMMQGEQPVGIVNHAITDNPDWLEKLRAYGGAVSTQTDG